MPYAAVTRFVTRLPTRTVRRSRSSLLDVLWKPGRSGLTFAAATATNASFGSKRLESQAGPGVTRTIAGQISQVGAEAPLRSFPRASMSATAALIA